MTDTDTDTDTLVRGDGFEVRVRAGETLLDALLRAGVNTPFSCRGGTCHTCLLRCVSGEVPAGAQAGLAPALSASGHFLPCVCHPVSDMHVAPAARTASLPVPKERPPQRPRPHADPDPQLWAALQHGPLLRRVLDDFYARVFADARLAPYFAGVTREHVAGKQYAFMRKLIAGDDVYFGDNMRNVHHWMTISPELFDHRQALMHSTLGEHGLSPEMIRRWAAYEEPFRPDIVKDAPLPKLAFGITLAQDGYAQEVLAVGAICDGCAGVLEAGERVRYHLRLGTISCQACCA